MKTQHTNRNKILAVVLVFLACAAAQIHAQQRPGGGSVGGGGFGGFGGGNNASRTSSSSTSSTYNNNGTVGSAVISVDPQTHNIVVIADAETSQQISNIIANLDVPKPQVLIKVVFMEVQRNNSSDIGVEGGFVKNNGGIASSGGNVFGLAGLNSVVTNLNTFGQPMSSALASGAGSSSGLGTFYQIVGSDFQATLRAIAQAGKVQVLSRPSILARDSQLAKIVVGQQVPLPTSVSYATSGSSTIPIVNVTYTDIGIILNVTPFIGANGLVEMIIQPQTSAVNFTQSQSIAPGVTAPFIDIRSADTVVVTPDGQTVVIGGLISNSKTSSESKVPFLGDIPLLGNLFKSKSKTDNKTELLIFLTPHIVESPSQLAMLSGSETRQSRLLTNSVSERELDQFLERVPVKKVR